MRVGSAFVSNQYLLRKVYTNQNAKKISYKKWDISGGRIKFKQYEAHSYGKDEERCECDRKR